jgi:ribosomal protein S18 acetylase RimI-like enzyme
MTHQIERAQAKDIDALVEFNLAMASETEDKPLDTNRLHKGITYALEHPAEAIYLVARSDRDLVGALMITFEWSDWRSGRFWWIQSVYVRPEWRRQGVYRNLHAAARSLALEDPNGCGIRLYVEQENTIAQHTYLDLGMVETHYRLFEEEFGR